MAVPEGCAGKLQDHACDCQTAAGEQASQHAGEPDVQEHRQEMLASLHTVNVADSQESLLENLSMEGIMAAWPGPG